MAFSGRDVIQNYGKYEGDADRIFFRSLWERVTFKWCDTNPDVVKWCSEETVIPYTCKTDGQVHHYYVDLKLQMSNGHTYLVEIKPKSQTMPPRQPRKTSARYITEVMTYAKNLSKWEAAHKFAESQGWKFQVWTEETLKNLGIRVLTRS